MKKIIRILIFVTVIILCLSIFPGCLVRKSETLYPKLDMVYQVTACGKEMTQAFVAESSYLEQISFDIQFPEGKPKNGSLVFTLCKEDGDHKILLEKELNLQNVIDAGFTPVEINKRIKRGELYSYSLKTDQNADFCVFYIVDEQDAALGNRTLYLDGDKIEGAGSVTAYNYKFPLNYKNILCLWAFLWLVGLNLMELFRVAPDWNKNSMVRKADSLLIRFQLPILILELFAVFLLLVRISRNEAVHWDEAYTWQLVKKSFPEMLRTTAADIHPPLYYTMVKIAMAIFGRSIFVAKMVSVAGTIASGILGVTLVRKRWGVKTAVPFVLTTGLATQIVYYSVDVRMYSWVIFFVLAAALFALEIIDTHKNGWWAGFTIVALGGIYTQYLSVIPLSLLYLFLLGWFLLRDRSQIKKWLICVAITIIGYFPWLSVVIQILQRESLGQSSEAVSGGMVELCQWAFQNNIIYSEFMPAVLSLLAAICLLLKRNWDKKEKIIVGFIGSLFLLTFGISMVLASYASHFWTNRYLVDVLLFLWLFLFLILFKDNIVKWGIGMIWLGIFVLSSYVIMQATELNTIPWINHAKELLEQVQEEEKIVYTFPTFDVLYEYYVPNAQFIWYEDADFDELGDEFYVIAWGGNDFSWNLYEKGILQKEILGNMRLEEGITAELWKITYSKEN